MNITREDQALLETEFPAEIEKEAAAQVETLSELYEAGFVKMASAAADAMDKQAEEDEDEDEEKEDKAEDKLNEGQKKEAAARGAFLARYYVDGLMKEGSERHGDELHYLYPSIYEALVKAGADEPAAESFVKRMQDKGKAAWNTAKAAPGKAWKATKDWHTTGAKEVGEGYQGLKAALTGKGTGINPGQVLEKADRIAAAKGGAKNLAKGLGRLGTVPAALAAIGGTAYGVNKYRQGKKEQE